MNAVVVNMTVETCDCPGACLRESTILKDQILIRWSVRKRRISRDQMKWRKQLICELSVSWMNSAQILPQAGSRAQRQGERWLGHWGGLSEYGKSWMISAMACRLR